MRRTRPLSSTLIWLLTAAPALAFLPIFPTHDPATNVRWDAAPHAATGGAGLHDGVQVAVEPGLAERLALASTGAVTPDDVVDLERAIRAAFAAWESPVLAFSVAFDGPVVRGTSAGQEIDLFVVPGTDPAFTTTGALAGVTFFDVASTPDRLLTNGTALPGFAFSKTDIFLNETNIAIFAEALFPTRQEKLDALQRLLMHEIGHAIGLGHPREAPSLNRDTDGDPLNPMPIDPTDPLGDLILSPAIDPDGIMSNLPDTIPGALTFTTLRNDERGGRDAMYPALADAICPPIPRNACRTAASTTLKIQVKGGVPEKTKLAWKWTKGEETAAADFGDPLTSRTYGLCVWTTAPGPLLALLVPPDPIKWVAKSNGQLAYKDKTKAADGVASVKLKPGVAGKAKAQVTAGGVNMAPPALGTVATPIVVQLVDHDSAGCFESVFEAGDVQRNDVDLLKAKRAL